MSTSLIFQSQNQRWLTFSFSTFASCRHWKTTKCKLIFEPADFKSQTEYWEVWRPMVETVTQCNACKENLVHDYFHPNCRKMTNTVSIWYIKTHFYDWQVIWRHFRMRQSRQPRDNPNALPSPATSTRVNSHKIYRWFDGDSIKACVVLQDPQAKKGVLWQR